MVLGPLIKTLIMSGVYYGINETVLRGEQSRRKIRNVIIGIALLWAAAALGLFGILFLAGSLFFQLGNADSLVKPAVITGGVTLLVAVGVAIEGVRFMRNV